MDTFLWRILPLQGNSQTVVISVCNCSYYKHAPLTLQTTNGSAFGWSCYDSKPFPDGMPSPVSFLSLWDSWHHPPPGHGFFYTFSSTCNSHHSSQCFSIFYYQWPIKWSISSPFKILWILLKNLISSFLSPPLYHPFVLKLLLLFMCI